MTKYHPYLIESQQRFHDFQVVISTKHYLALILQLQPKVFNFHQFLFIGKLINQINKHEKFNETEMCFKN